MTTIVQLYCTLNDLEQDLTLRGGGASLVDKIKAASRMVAMEIGRFQPVKETRVLKGNQTTQLYIPPLIGSSALAIVNDGTSLVSGDYLLRPSGRHWDNGPYSWLDIATDATNLTRWCDEEDGISITDLFGLYHEQVALDLTLGAAMNASQTTMQVNDGSKVSPGFLAVIGDETLAVLSDGSPSTSVTTLAAELSADDESATFTSGAAVQIGEILRISFEKVKVLDINSNAVYLARGWEGTLRSTHANGAAVDAYRTFNVLRGVNGTTAASHDNAAAILQQTVPADVNFLTRKIAGRMLLDAQGGFKSRLDDETGTGTRLYILPHELENLKKTYRVQD